MSSTSEVMVLKEPLSPDAATKLIHEIAREGDVGWSTHAGQEMLKDGLSTVDCLNVMRAGAVFEPADLESGTWRYRIQTNRICVVVAFESETELVIVTTWRIRR
jgi:hypothetical protein